MFDWCLNNKKHITMYQKKSWSPHEDELIRKAVQQMGDRPRWKYIAQRLNQALGHQETSSRRTPKQCRQRWHNKLDPQILDKQWDEGQINKLFQLHNEHGNKWSMIATMMNGRTDNCVKNKFYSALRKGMRKINKYIVNLKRKLSVNKNICIKQFKDVVLAKLIAVADRKYKDKLDVKENSQSKTEILSQAIKLALVKISNNEDDYVGHVRNGVADGQYQIEENLFKNIQEFCRNCKRKKGKRKESESNELASEMVEESQQLQQQRQQVCQDGKTEEIKAASKSSFLNVSKIKGPNQKNIADNKVNAQEKQNTVLNNMLFREINEENGSSLKNLQFKASPNFKSFDKNLQTVNNKESWLKISAQQNRFSQQGLKENKSSLTGDTDFFNSIRCVGEPNVQFQKTDHNNKQPQNFRIQEIFLHCSNNPLQNSNNNLSLASSNANFFGDISGSMGFLSRSRALQNPFDINPAAVYYSSSYSSSSNNKHEKVIQIPHNFEKPQKKEEKFNLQKSSQNFQINSSFQLQDFLRRTSERQQRQ